MKAFPNGFLTLEGKVVASQEGMDLRDYFAAQAMAQMNWVNVELSAQEAYRVADAMMKARKL